MVFFKVEESKNKKKTKKTKLKSPLEFGGNTLVQGFCLSSHVTPTGPLHAPPMLPSAHLGPTQVFLTPELGLDQMVTVDGGRHSHLGQSTADELQHGHLGRGILHGHAVRPQPQVGLASLDLLVGRVIQVSIHDLL